MRATAVAAVVLGLSCCAAPPPSAYLGGRADAGGIAIGSDASGEACTQQSRGVSGAVDVFCGQWQQPSASVSRAGSGDAQALTALATSSPWRTAIDTRFACGGPRPTTVLGEPALLLDCTRRVGGWPQVALVAAVGGQLYTADAIEPAVPTIPRVIGVLSGRVAPSGVTTLPRSGVEELVAQRLAAQSFSAGDVGQFDDLIVAGTRANLAESYVAAEQAYRAALALQRKALGKDTPEAASTLALIALQLSDQGAYPEAATLFAEAERLAPRASDKTTPARVAHYRALDAVNQGHDEAALPLLRQAEAEYRAQLPPEAFRTRVRASSPFALGRSGTASVNNPIPGDDAVVDPAQQSALLGVLETRRYQAIVLRDLGRLPESEAAIQSAAALAAAQGLRQPVLTARLLRTAAATAAAQGDNGGAVTGLGLSSIAFGQAQPGSRPLAATELLRAARLHQEGRDGAARESCRRAVALLRDLKQGASPGLVEPCLQVYAATAGDGDQAGLAEMFEAAQLGQSSVTSEQIARAAARLREGARDPRVAEAIRRREQAGDRLAELVRQRDAQTLQAQGSYVPQADSAGRGPADLDGAITQARGQLADADGALQAASPNYGQLVQDVTPAADVLAALRGDEAFVSIALGQRGGWVFVLRQGRIAARPVGVSTAEMAALVGRFRKSVTLGDTDTQPPPFDREAALGIYQATLGTVAPQLEGAKELVVAPSGSLLSIPFPALLTGPSGADLAQAPFLVRRFSVSHVPAAANFVALRRVAGTSRASRPWLGMGDFRPITLAQAQLAFPGPNCAQSARLFASLPALPFAGRELEAARQLMGGERSDELTGAAYTVPAVEHAPLKTYRILHFASHGLLPAELACAQEPAIVTSAPPGAANGSGALLTSSLISSLDLDADAVILSACNSAGPNGPAGESLSGLARAFFFAGARALMVTHWSVNDQTSAFLVADTLRRLKEGQDGGLAGSLRGAELGLLDGAGKNLPAQVAHPFYWAPFALIGDGSRALRTAGIAGHGAGVL